MEARATGKEPSSKPDGPVPAILTSLTGLLENTRVLNVFSSATVAVGKAGVGGTRVASFARASQHGGDGGDHAAHGADLKGAPLSVETNGRGHDRKQKIDPPVRLPSDGASSEESDMPGLERLERSTVAASSDDEARAEDVRMYTRQIDELLKTEGGLGKDGNLPTRAGTVLSASQTTPRVAKAATGIHQAASRSETKGSVITTSTPATPAASGTWSRERLHTSNTSSSANASRNLYPYPAYPNAAAPSGGGSGMAEARVRAQEFFAARDGEADLGATAKTSTPAAAARASTVSAKDGRPLPAPLDLSAVGKPSTPPAAARKKEPYVSASQPVVLQGAALESLQRLGRPGSSVSSFGSKGGSLTSSAASSAVRGRGSTSIRPGATAFNSAGGGAPACAGPRAAAAATRRGGQGRMALARSDSGGAGVSSYPRGAAATPSTQQAWESGRSESDEAPPLPSPMLTAHLRGSSSRVGKTRQQQHARVGRGAFNGRGLRPSTWTEDDTADGVAPGIAPAAHEQAHAGVGEVKLRLVRQTNERNSADLPSAAGGRMNNGVSPMGTPISIASVSTDARGGCGSRGFGKVTGDDAKSSNLNTLQQVAADIAKRGASGDPELLPGLGRSAFELVSVSPTIPLRSNGDGLGEKKLAKAVVQEVPRAKGVSEEATPASAGASSHSSSKLPSKHPKHRSDVSSVDLAGEKMSHVLDAARSRSSAMTEDAASVGSAGLSSVLTADAPSLTVAHAPGRIYEPVPYRKLLVQQHHHHHHQQQQQQQQQGPVAARGTRANGDRARDRQPPFRLSSSKRLMSFDSRRSSVSPVGWDRRAAAEERNSQTRSPASGGGVGRRPTTIDLLSTFGSHHSLSRDEDALRRSGSTVMPSHLEDMREEEQGGYDEGGEGRRHSRHEGSGGGGGGGGGGGSSRTGRESVRSDRISQRRSRSSGSNGGGTRRFNSGSALTGIGVDDTRSLSRGRRPTASRSQSIGSAFGEERASSRDPALRTDSHKDKYTARTPATVTSTLSSLGDAGDPIAFDDNHRSRRHRSERREERSGSGSGGGGGGGDDRPSRSEHSSRTSSNYSDKARRRHSADRGQQHQPYHHHHHHRRRSSRGGIDLSGVGDGDQGRGHRRSGSSDSRASSSRRDRAHESELAAVREVDCSATGTRGASGSSESAGRAGGNNGRKESGEISSSAVDGAAAAAGAGRSAGLASGDGIVANVTSAAVPVESAAGQRTRHHSASSNQVLIGLSPSPSSTKRSLRVKKKATKRGFLGLKTLFRSAAGQDEQRPPAPEDTVRVPSARATSKTTTTRRPHVVATPVRVSRQASLRGYVRSESQELTSTTAGAAAGRGRAIPAFNGWLARMFTRRAKKKRAGRGQSRPEHRQRRQQRVALRRKTSPPAPAPAPPLQAAAADAADGEAVDVGGVDEKQQGLSLSALASVLSAAAAAASASTSTSATAPPQKSLSEERVPGGGALPPRGVCYTQFYDEPLSPEVQSGQERYNLVKRKDGSVGLGSGTVGGDVVGGGGGGIATQEDPEGGERVQHLLRTSLYMKTQQSLVSQKSRADSTSSDPILVGIVRGAGASNSGALFAAGDRS